MKVTRKDGETACVLSHAERQTMDRAFAIFDQLAFHYRATEHGERAKEVATDIATLIALDAFGGPVSQHVVSANTSDSAQAKARTP